MNNAKKYLSTGTVPPANLFNFLRACYGGKEAENIFRTYGLPTPTATAPHAKNERLHAIA